MCCNACWCRRRSRRLKEQETVETPLATGPRVQERRSLRPAAVRNTAVQGSAASEEMQTTGPAAQQSQPLGAGRIDSAAGVSIPVAAAECLESMQAGAADEDIVGAATAAAEADRCRTGPGSVREDGLAAGPGTLAAAKYHAPSAGGTVDSAGAATPSVPPRGTQLVAAGIEEGADMAAAPAAAEPRQRSKTRSGRSVSSAAAREAAPAVERSQKRESRGAEPGPAAGAERARRSAVVALGSRGSMPATGSSLQPATRLRAAGLHSEATAPATTAAVHRSLRSGALASSSPAAVPAATVTIREAGAVAGAAAVAPRVATRSGSVRMVSPRTVLPAVSALQRSVPPGALPAEHPIAVLADGPDRTATGRSGTGERLRRAAAPAAAPAAQRSTRSGVAVADSSAAVLTDAPANHGTMQSRGAVRGSASAALAAARAVQSSGCPLAPKGTAAAPTAEPSVPAMASRPQRASKLAAPQLWRGAAGVVDSSGEDQPPKPKPRATVRLSEAPTHSLKPTAARGWKARSGSRLRLPGRAAKLAVARARHLSRRADELNYFGARPRSAAGRDSRSRLLHKEGKRHRCVTWRMQEAMARPRHGLGVARSCACSLTWRS